MCFSVTQESLQVEEEATTAYKRFSCRTDYRNGTSFPRTVRDKLQALVYDILPSTTAVFSYVIGSWKLSANEQFFVGAQTVVSLLQTTQIKQGLSFTAANKVYTSTNKTTIVWNETELFVFTRGGCVSCLHACLGATEVTVGRRWPRRWTAVRR